MELARIILPFPCADPPYELIIHIGFTGPKGARLRVSVDGRELFNQFIGPGEWRGTFQVERDLIQERALIELSSDTFVLRQIMEGWTDGRTLGVALYAVGCSTKN